MAVRGSTVSLELPREYVGQILDGLDVLIDQWTDTSAALSSNDGSGDWEVIRECASPEEANNIANYYREIREAIVSQMGDGSIAS